MENAKKKDQEAQSGRTKAQAFLEEWRRRRKEDEEKFLKDLGDPEYRKKLEAIRGKVVNNGKTVSN